MLEFEFSFIIHNMIKDFKSVCEVHVYMYMIYKEPIVETMFCIPGISHVIILLIMNAINPGLQWTTSPSC